MLTALSYLGEDAAYEVSVANPNQLAAQIDTLRPFSAENFPVFALPNAAQRVRSICQARMTELYGVCPPEPIRSRLEEELTLFGDEARPSLFLLAHAIRSSYGGINERRGRIICVPDGVLFPHPVLYSMGRNDKINRE